LRLAIDRVFAPMGRGVVVTGTLRGGSVAQGATLQRLPGDEVVRIRSLQVHGTERPRHDGGRVAFNVAGDVASQLRRGDVLSRVGEIRAEDRLLVQLLRPAELGAPSPWPPKGRRALRLHAGTAQVNAALRLLPGADAVADPVADLVADSVAVLTLEEPVATFAGDRLVLRDPARGAVVAGVRVLEPAPPRGAGRRRMTPERLAALIDAVTADDADRIAAARVDLHGALPLMHTAETRTSVREVALASDVTEALIADVSAAVAEHHRTTPMSSGLPQPKARMLLLRRLRSMAAVRREHEAAARAAVDRLLDALVLGGTLLRRGDALRDPSIAGDLSTELVDAMTRLEAALSVAGPPALRDAAIQAGCPPEGVRALVSEGRIVRLGEDLAWATPTYHRLAATALERARTAPLTPAAFRDATGTSRKFVMAILEDLDRRGILARTPDGHVPGPRAPRATGELRATGEPAS
jgi:selenocysteine-specific elongation factor